MGAVWIFIIFEQDIGETNAQPETLILKLNFNSQQLRNDQKIFHSAIKPITAQNPELSAKKSCKIKPRP